MDIIFKPCFLLSFKSQGFVVNIVIITLFYQSRTSHYFVIIPLLILSLIFLDLNFGFEAILLKFQAFKLEYHTIRDSNTIRRLSSRPTEEF